MQSLVSIQQSGELIRPNPATVQALLERFLAAQDVSPGSRATYGRQLQQFFLWLQQTGRSTSPTGLHREDLLAYKDHLSSSKSSYTVAGYLTAVRKFFSWLESERIYPDISRGLKGGKKARGFRKDCLTPDQLRSALERIDRSTLEGLRDYALFNLLVRTGLRTVEVSKAQVGDLRQETGVSVLWIQGKGRSTKDDFVLLVEEALQPVRTYLSARARLLGPASEGQPIFSSVSDRNAGAPLTPRSISRIVKEALLRAGLDSGRLTAHSLRHTAITLAIMGGASLQQAQAMARHSDTRTTLVYFHNLERIKAGAERFIQF